MEMYDNKKTVGTMFDADFLPEPVHQAQWAEFVELKKIITELSQAKKRPITILDIGVGNARVPKHLAGIKEIWHMVGRYDGIDNAKKCIKISNKVIRDLRIQKKVSIQFYNALQLNLWKKKYDIVILTWFTAGNFYPENFPFESYGSSKQRLDLSKNEKFNKIFANAFRLIKPGGELIIGSYYIDNDATRIKQEEFYKKCGMTVITDKKDQFTATEERFWSQRFTKEKLKSYLKFLSPKKFTFIPLDTYQYAMMLRVKK